ncbi:MAG: FG-GAP-like repeat-containing protein, partial [Nanoarchaeota archaeon]
KKTNNIAYAVDKVTDFITGEAGVQMTPYSSFLNDLNNGDPHNFWDRQDITSPDVSHYTYIGTKDNWITTYFLVGEDDGWVRQNSVHLDGVPGFVYDLSHSQLTYDSPVYDHFKDNYLSLEKKSIYLPKNIFPDINNFQELPVIKGSISGVEEKNHEINIDSVDMVVFDLVWIDGLINFSLTSPSGVLIDKDYAENNDSIEYYTDSYETVVIINDSEPGLWKLHVSGLDINGSTEYDIFTFVESNLTVTNIIDKYQYDKNELLYLKVNLTKGINIVTGATISAKINKPDGTETFVYLYDDGWHNDGSFGDGIYGNVYSGMNKYGQYNIEVTALGNYEGDDFSREFEYAIWVEGYPDLTINNITLSQSSFIEGDNIVITAEVKNLADFEARNATIGLYLKDLFGDVMIDNVTIDIDAFDIAIVLFNWTNISAGIQNVSVMISPFNEFIELNYDNNRHEMRIDVRYLSRTLLNNYSKLKVNFSNNELERLFFVKVHKDVDVEKAYMNIEPSYAYWIMDNSTFGSMSIGEISSPEFRDLDGDDDLDLVIGKSDGKLGYYKNVGTRNLAVWVYESSMFDGIDVGEGSNPEFVDIGADNDWDLVIGEKYGNLSYYENIGTRFSPTWSLSNLSFDGVDFGMFIQPKFVNLDNDGDFDLVIGNQEGGLYYYENIGTQFLPIWRYNESVFDGIDVGRHSSPEFLDLDRDRDMDLLVGEFYGKLYYYENIGTKFSPVWSYKDLIFDNIGITYLNTPAVVDIDDDGDLDLLIGEGMGRLNYFENIYNISRVELDITNNGITDSIIYNYNVTEIEFTNRLNEYKSTHNPEDDDYYYIPLIFKSDSIGSIIIYDINISIEPLIVCNDLETQLCPIQTGICENSFETCVDGQWNCCGINEYNLSGNYELNETLRDGLDNDCDGLTDEIGKIISDSDGDGVIDEWDLCSGTISIYTDRYGCPMNITIDLFEGWNLIQSPTLTIEKINETLKNVNYSFVLNYNNSMWYSYGPDMPLNTLNYFIPGYGYWIKVNEDKTLTLS